ncbi:hypothetical protein B0H66DRAFT_7410 [Apodospora peruviana]|uniref:Dihydroneopterin aldolase/epimerase domain-containing protein n=1 Tax=Apodospora peruviana TaxID=516989 RepID=A0AAE0IPS9_9PEZI|nr:hypothetical protein B0H66DRAFT_7410 [Apodospora peruviana]
MPASPLSSSWTVRASAGEPFAVVQVRNLQTTIEAAVPDAWGRPHKLQPLLVSAELSFAQPFAAAAADDQLGSDTVHYGTLSKAILDSLRIFSTAAVTETLGRSHVPSSLRDVLETVWVDLTGFHVDGSRPPATPFSKREPFLSPASLSRVKFLRVTLLLPKASLLGDGVSLTASSVFKAGEEGVVAEQHGVELAIHGLKVPTLIGINENERLAKQFVIATVTIDKFAQSGTDIFTDVEALVVNTLESSSFETLEALGAHLANSILTKYRSDEDACQWLVHIRMEKPTATPLAECPVVEIRTGAVFPELGRPTAASHDATS